MATIAEIQQLYIIYLGRPADPNGLDFWFSKPLTALQIANAFGSTPEYQQRLANLGVAGSINQIYQNVFGRSPDAAGLQFWTQKVQTGQLSLETAGFVITNSAVGVDVTTRDNKQASAALYTANVRTSTQSILAYDTTSGLNAGVAYLTGITTTAATEAQVQAAVNTMTTNSGGGSGGLTFNQIAGFAVLTTGANTNNAGTGAGFTPSASTLTNGNDIIKIGVFQGATIQDGSTGDNDTLLLDAAGFAAQANAVAGVETITFNGVNSFQAGTITGAKTVNLNKAANFISASQTNTATYFIANTGVNSLQGANLRSLAFNLSAANSGVLALGSTTAIVGNNTLTANNTYTVSQGAAAGSIAFNAGSASTFTLNLAGAGVYTGGAVFSAESFRLRSIGNVGKFTGDATANQAISFASTGLNTYEAQLASLAAETISLSAFSGLDSFARVQTADGNALASVSAIFNLKDGAFSLGYFTANLTANLGTGFIGSAIQLRALNATSAVDGTVTLSLNAGGTNNAQGGTFSLVSAITILTNTTAAATTAAGASSIFNTLNLNVFNVGSNLILSNALTLTANGGLEDTLQTFNLNAGTATVFATFTQGGIGYSQLTNFGFSQSDGGLTFIYGSGLSANRTISVYGGSGNDTFTFINGNVATYTAAGQSVTAISTSAFNVLDLSDGGNDTVEVIRFNNVANGTSAGTLVNVKSFGVGDVLTFTAGFNALVQQNVAGNAWAAGTLNLYFDGTNTWVGNSTDNNNRFNQVQVTALVVKLEGVNYADVTKWNLVNNSIRLIAA